VSYARRFVLVGLPWGTPFQGCLRAAYKLRRLRGVVGEVFNANQ
jgi:hypothetical protein